MGRVTYIESNGEERQVDLDNGQSIMQGALDNMIEGILGECGGCCSCATCHCYVDEAWLEKVGAPDDMERDMLDSVVDPKSGSRLSCQIQMSEHLDGLVVRLPESQF